MTMARNLREIAAMPELNGDDVIDPLLARVVEEWVSGLAAQWDEIASIATSICTRMELLNRLEKAGYLTDDQHARLAECNALAGRRRSALARKLRIPWEGEPPIHNCPVNAAVVNWGKASDH